MKLRLKEKLQETADVHTFLFEPEAPVIYRAGQYLRYIVDHPNPDKEGTKRYFTIASAPSEHIIQLTTRYPEHVSTFKQTLLDLPVGAEIEAIGPMGDFTYPHPEKEVVFLAGGIGITPFRSMLVELATTNTFQAPITLLYANRSSDIAFKELFDQLAAEHPQLKVIYVEGRIDETIINQNVSDLQNPLFYVSGPEAMVEAMSGMLQGLGVEKTRIEEDFFPGYEN